MARWWDQDFARASQQLYGDQGMALQVATLPNAVLTGQQLADPEKVKQAEQAAQLAKGGFMDKIKASLGLTAGAVDKVMSNVPGWGLWKQGAAAAFYPVDKLASAAYWAYSNVISQPLSTYILASGKAFVENDITQLASPGTWTEAYAKAEHISPGQAAANYGATLGRIEAQEGLGSVIAGQADPDVVRQSERFLYDSEYWRNKAGWKYTAGTGAVDFTVSLAADPTYAAVKGTGMAVKGFRNIETGAGRALPGLAKTPQEAAKTANVNKLYDWMEGKSGPEIAAHPSFGKGRRKNQFADVYGEVYAHTTREQKNLITRFQLGDPAALAEVATKHEDLAVQLSRLNDNRQVLDSMKFDPDLLGHFATEEQALRVGANLPAPAGSMSPSTTGPGKFPKLLEPPYPRPTHPGPRQSGWDATYGHLAAEARAYRGAASELLKAQNATPRKLFGGVAISDDDILRANTWRDAKLTEMDIQIDKVYAQKTAYSVLLGENASKPIDELAPGASALFGTSKTLYRTGYASGSQAKMGDKAVRKLGSGRGNWESGGGIATRVIRNGFLRTPTRIIQTFGERMPQGFVNHHDDDAPSRVMDLLKQVRGMDPDQRIGLVSEYSAQLDKVGRKNALDAVHGAIVHHYAQAYNLDPAVAKELNEMIRDGIASTMGKLTGFTPRSQKFTSLSGSELATLSDEGEALVVLPNAKTQLSYGDALLDVREFERYIDRHSGYLQGFKQGMGSAKDFVGATGDNLSRLWKASTLLRPGYTLRAVSEESAASVVKFGILSRLGDLGAGGWNFMQNRQASVMALVGEGSYVPTTGKAAGSKLARVRIGDPDALRIAEKYGLKTTRIQVNQAWPLVESRIKHEQELAKGLEKDIAKLKAKGFDTGPKQAQLDDSLEIIREHTDYAKAILAEARDSTGKRLAEGTFTYRGEEVGEAFHRGWENVLPRDQITSNNAVSAIFSRGESIDMGRLVKTGSWDDVTPDMPHHMQSWLDDINKQMRQDPLYRLMAQDPTGKAAKAWLKTPEGKHHISQLGEWAQEPSELLKVIQLTMDKYVPRGTGLQNKIAANEEIFEAELRAAIREEDFPVVHGEEVRATSALSAAETARHYSDKVISAGYKFLAGTPSDVLNWHPVFNRAYKVRMMEAIDQHKAYRASISGDESITVAEMNKMYEKAAKMAKNDIRQVVYDPQRTTASEALRFIYPFFTAHADSLQRWSGLIAERPETLIGISKIYNAPVAANLITDSHGNHVGQDGYAEVEITTVDPATGEKTVTKERKFVPIDERVLNLRLPWDTKNQWKWGKENIKGYGVPIKIQAMNTILPGDPWFNPGTGPLVQAPASVIAKRAPQVGDFLQWSKVLPYGPNDSVLDSFTPKYMKEAYNAFTAGDQGNEKYQQAYLDVYNRKVAENFETGEPVDLKDVEAEAKQFMFLQAFTAWASPAQTKETPLTGSQYQFFVDQYKKLQEVDPKNAAAIFQATYGQQYAHFTTSLSKSIGIAPTIAAMTKSEEYKDLIEQDPEMASFIVGATYSGGAFSASVYRRQMEELAGGKPVREKQSALDAVRENQVSLGWSMFMKNKGWLDSLLIQAGFRSYQDRGAEGFVQRKLELEQMVATKYPEWQKQRGVIDTQKISNRIAFFEKAVQDKRLQSDPLRFDIAGLDMYLQGRRYYKELLAQRGLQELSFDASGQPTRTSAGADIAYAWRQFQMGIVNGNTQFNDVYNRYLENDNLQ